jgi:hypothetical protein
MIKRLTNGRDIVGRDVGSNGYIIGNYGIDAPTSSFPLVAFPLAIYAYTIGGACGTNSS